MQSWPPESRRQRLRGERKSVRLSIYIGLLRCSLTCSKFARPDTTPFDAGAYENWADGEPTIEGGQLACVEMLGNGEWNDLTCDSQRLFVCEKPANAAPPAL